MLRTASSRASVTSSWHATPNSARRSKSPHVCGRGTCVAAAPVTEFERPSRAVLLSLKSECLERMIFFGERSLSNAVIAFLLHYHAERNHQGLENTNHRPRRGSRQPHRRSPMPRATRRAAELLPPAGCSSAPTQNWTTKRVAEAIRSTSRSGSRSRRAKSTAGESGLATRAPSHRGPRSNRLSGKPR